MDGRWTAVHPEGAQMHVRKTGTGAKRGRYLRRALCDFQGLSPLCPFSAGRSSCSSDDDVEPRCGVWGALPSAGAVRRISQSGRGCQQGGRTRRATISELQSDCPEPEAVSPWPLAVGLLIVRTAGAGHNRGFRTRLAAGSGRALRRRSGLTSERSLYLAS
jgi:hypothetical protein